MQDYMYLVCKKKHSKFRTRGTISWEKIGMYRMIIPGLVSFGDTIYKLMQ